MDIVYVPGKVTKKVVFPLSIIKQLPKELCLFMTVQFIDQKQAMKKALEKHGITVFFTQPRHTAFEGQIYGCSTLPIDKQQCPGEAFLYIGDGIFHPYALLFNNERLVYHYNPFTHTLKRYTKKDIEEFIKRKKAAYVAFLHAKTVGVLVSTKPGQNRMYFAEQLPQEFPEKKFYFFLNDTLDFQQLENFPYIEVFVNTMCPRIGLDDTRRTPKPIINLDDISAHKF